MGKGRGWRQFFKPSVAKHWGPKPARLHRASRACLRFVAAEACAPGLCLRSVPSVPDFCFCWRRAKSIQCMALAAISHGSAHGLLAPEMLARRKDWVQRGCSFTYGFYPSFVIAWLSCHFEGLLARPAIKTCCQRNVSIIPRSNDIMQIIHPNLSCLEMIIPLTQDWKKTVLSCSRNWTCPAGCLPWRQRGSPPVARGH